MEWLDILALVAGIIGIIGSIAPGLPGPPLSWVGLLLVYLSDGGKPMEPRFLWIWLAITVVVTIVDYVVPAMFTKVTGGSRYAVKGSIAGLIVGLVFPPVGMILGSLLGAFLMEYFYADKGVMKSFIASIGSFFGFIFGTGIKLAASGVMLYYIIRYFPF